MNHSLITTTQLHKIRSKWSIVFIAEDIIESQNGSDSNEEVMSNGEEQS